ncbi:MAG: GtrA family protein [Fulvimonas sp.]|mgnify:CR=1 FL=1|jgi:putative flippase GtrA|nr:GtrA family protein [Fulvimonas sp.]
MRWGREVTLFAVGGVLGLIVDAGGVQLLVALAGCNPYLARIPSFLVAATVTWWWNRRHTFAGRTSGRPAYQEWLHWMGLMSFGAVVNYATYAALLTWFQPLHRWPALATAGGSVVAAAVNFATARVLLFKKSHHHA